MIESRKTFSRLGLPVFARGDNIASRQVLGHYAYYGISGNSRALGCFWHEVKQLWHYWLKRRSRAAKDGERLWRLMEERFRLPPARLVHKPIPNSNGHSQLGEYSP